ncbi:hypothetical protein ACWD0J_32895 [Streptomyces sp. NPDC003011]
MSDHTPSQAEGEPDDADPQNTGHPAPDHPTPSQAEGDRDDADDDAVDGGDDRP